MRKRWPVRDMTAMPWTVEAPANWTSYDAVQIQVSVTPTIGGEVVPINAVHSRIWITQLEAMDMRALDYLARQLVDMAMREWNGSK